MPFLRFLVGGIDRSLAMEGSHDPSLVLLSYLAAALAAYAALSIADRLIAAETPLGRKSWLAAGALAMGSGVWSMHFIGMLAFDLPVPVTYNVLVTLISMLPAIFASLVMLLVLARSEITGKHLVIGGVLMGAGIGAMHYTGMAAMRMYAEMYYDPAFFALSIAVAVALAAAALHVKFFVARRMKIVTRWAEAAGAMVMGLAVAGMHYTAMAAAYFFPTAEGGPPPMAGEPSVSLDPAFLGGAIGAATLLVTSLALAAAVVDRRLRAAVQSVREESEERTRAIVDSAYEGIVTIGERGVVESFNPAASEIFGYPPWEVIGQNVGMLMPEPFKSQHDEYIASYLRTGRKKIIGIVREVEGRRKDGAAFPVELTVNEFFLGGRRVFVGAVRDISARKRAERQRETHIERQKTLNLLAAKISASLDPDEVFRHVVRAAAEFLQADFAVLFTAENGELAYRADHGGWLELRKSAEIHAGGASHTVYRTGKPLYIEDVNQFPGWKSHPWTAAQGIKSYLGVPLMRSGDATGVLSVRCRGVRKFSDEDIELLTLLASHAAIAIEKAELHEEAQKGVEFFRSVLDASPNPIQVLDAENRIIYWNAAAEALLGYTAKEISGETTGIIVPESEKARTREAAAQLMRGEPVSYETVRRRRDGMPVPVRVAGAPVRDAGGRVVARTVIFQDLTGRKRAEREREEFTERLKALHLLAAKISSTLDLDEVLSAAVESAAGILNITYVSLFTLDAAGEMVLRAETGRQKSPGSVTRFPPGEGIVSIVARTGAPVYAPDVLHEPKFVNKEWARRLGIGSYLGVPMKIRDQVVGTLSCMTGGVRKFSQEEIGLLALLANHAAIAIEKATLYQNVQKGQEFLRSVLDSSADPIVVADRQGSIIFWSHAAETLYGHSADEMIGKKPDLYYVPEGERAQREEAMARVLRGEQVSYETHRRRKDGTLVPVRLTASPVRDAAGGVVARTVILQDLTGQKRAEREREADIGRLKALNSLISQISSTLMEEEVLAFVVRAASELLGLSLVILFVKDERGDLVARAHTGKWAEIIGMERLPKGEGVAGLVTSRGEPVYLREVAEAPEFMRKEEARRLGIGSYLGLPLKVRGEVIGVLSCMTEGAREFTREEVELAVTLAGGAATAAANAQAHAQLQEAFGKLKQSQALLIRAEKLSSIGTLTAGAAHEILNPANIIGLHAQRLMWENAEGTSPHQSATVILRNVERISRICEDLRRFSREEAAKREPFNPDDALRQCLRPLESELRLAGVEVRYRLAKEAPTLLGDKGQIQQVFFNLLRNAMDAMPQGGALTVASREVAEEGARWWETRVSDTGTGIPPEVMPRIFDPFFTTKPEDKGTGLGLSVSYGIVESHGGKIWAENNPDGGAAFIVRLPIEEEGHEQAAPARSDRG